MMLDKWICSLYSAVKDLTGSWWVWCKLLTCEHRGKTFQRFNGFRVFTCSYIPNWPFAFLNMQKYQDIGVEVSSLYAG